MHIREFLDIPKLALSHQDHLQIGNSTGSNTLSQNFTFQSIQSFISTFSEGISSGTLRHISAKSTAKSPLIFPALNFHPVGMTHLWSPVTRVTHTPDGGRWRVMFSQVCENTFAQIWLLSWPWYRTVVTGGRNLVQKYLKGFGHCLNVFIFWDWMSFYSLVGLERMQNGCGCLGLVWDAYCKYCKSRVIRGQSWFEKKWIGMLDIKDFWWLSHLSFSGNDRYLSEANN